MKRTLITIVLTVAALALLAGTAMQSRSIPLETHIAYYQLTADLNRLALDFETLAESLQTAWDSGQPPADVADALRARLTEGQAAVASYLRQIPGDPAQSERLALSSAQLGTVLAATETLTSRLIRDQAEFAARLNLLRDRGNALVGDLRSRGRNQMATDLAQLVEETLARVSPGAASAAPRNDNISFLLVTLNRDLRIDSRAPRETETVLSTVESLLDAKGDIDSHLKQLSTTPLPQNASALASAAGEAYESSVARADRARMVLSVYAVVLLLVIGVFAFRLRKSYRQLNLANEELGDLNESLEQRVNERTQKLSDALTDLKESQVQLVQAEKMSSLGQLVAGISHEINTPLLYLANNAELTQERIDLINDFIRESTSALCVNRSEFENSGEYQTHLIQGLRRLKRLLRDNELEATVEELADLNRDSIEGLEDLSAMAQSLKDFSRLDRAPIDSFDVNAGIEKTLTIARNIVKQKADVVKEFGKLPPIECSPSKINQVFLNLITNAAQAIDGHGEITITTEKQGEDAVVISIADNGCGIAPENLSKICDPFFTTKEVGSGTGLGLSIVDEIVRSHGGELRIESKVGEGSTFSVVLPIRQSKSAGEAAVDAILAEAV